MSTFEFAGPVTQDYSVASLAANHSSDPGYLYLDSSENLMLNHSLLADWVSEDYNFNSLLTYNITFAATIGTGTYSATYSELTLSFRIETYTNALMSVNSFVGNCSQDSYSCTTIQMSDLGDSGDSIEIELL
jgi:hypothetical protein